MGNFTSKFTKTFHFDGDEISVGFTRMKNKHFILIAPYLVLDDSEPKALRAGMLRSVKLVEESKQVLKECIIDIKGIKDSAGRELLLDDILEQAYFISLLDQMLGQLMDASVLRESDAKKSVEPPPAISQGLESNQMSSLESPSTGGGSSLQDVTT